MYTYSGAHPVRRAVVAIGCVLALMGAAACSSSADESKTTSSTSRSLSPDLVKLIPASYKSKGSLDVIVWHAPPWDFQNEQGSVTRGIVVDIYKELEKRTGLKVKLIPGRTDAIQPGLASGRYDGSAMFADFATRHAALDIVDAAKVVFTVLHKPGGSFDPTNIKNICGKTITAQAGTYTISLMEWLTTYCQAQGLPKVSSLVLPDKSSELLAIKSGRADADIDESAVLSAIAKESNGELVATTPTDWSLIPHPTTIVTGPAFAKDSGLAPLVLQFYKDIYADGTYKSIYSKFTAESAMLQPSEFAINASTQ